MSAKNPDWSLLVFARAPVAGAAKTRLIPLLGADGAARLQERFIDRTLATAHAARPDRLMLWCEPDTTHDVLRRTASRHGASLHAQNGADLGARMHGAFAHALPDCRFAIGVGTDCPALETTHLHAACEALHAGHDAVFAPAEDGGYALIGLRHADAFLFSDIPWGTDRVMDETRQRLRESGLLWHELATLWDVDRPEDYHRLLQSGLHRDTPSPI